jgi:filamentous hemagglutinin family protein
MRGLITIFIFVKWELLIYIKLIEYIFLSYIIYITKMSNFFYTIDGKLQNIEAMSNVRSENKSENKSETIDTFNLRGNINLAGNIRAKDFLTEQGASILKDVDNKLASVDARIASAVNSVKDSTGLPKTLRVIDNRLGVNKEKPLAELDVGGSGSFDKDVRIGGMLRVNRSTENPWNAGWGNGVHTWDLKVDGSADIANSRVRNDMAFTGGNNWILHTPDDKRRTMYVAPSKAYGNEDWNWEAATELDENGNIRPGNNIMMRNGKTINADGRLHIAGGEHLYLLNKNGVIIGKEWGGNGNLSVQGNADISSINTPQIRRSGGDWLRINNDGVGRTALYGNLSINDTVGDNGGLAVGTWNDKVGTGNILATGNVTALGGANLEGSIKFRHRGANGSDDSDPYSLEKIRTGENNNSLRLTINDDADESFQIWGNSCGTGNCGGPGKELFKFDGNGNFCIGKTCINESQLQNLINFSNMVTK